MRLSRLQAALAHVPTADTESIRDNQC